MFGTLLFKSLSAVCLLLLLLLPPEVADDGIIECESTFADDDDVPAAVDDPKLAFPLDERSADADGSQPLDAALLGLRPFLLLRFDASFDEEEGESGDPDA